ncbi:MAG: hypothetical protein ACYC0V_15625 [Armatimonadota bacterium]
MNENPSIALELRRTSAMRSWSALIPYAAVLVGIYVLGNVWAAILGYHIGAVICMMLNRDLSSGQSQPDDRSASLAAFNMLVGLLAGILLYVLWPMLGISADFGARLNALGLTSWPAFGIYYCAANPIIEELFWHRNLETESPYPAWNDFMFAGYHMLVLALFMRWEWLIPSYILLVFASWIWGQTSRLKHGFPIIIASHLLADIGIIVTAYIYAVR